ncbi:maltose/maltodextrin transport system permease protein [Oceanotoga teriensis]|uniref:Maltose/maltodextrin transport system permease protein n=1 Tax=Oceanotoga teriensis TaxID=515440 RepID=A0AA45HIA1_9BACT|nr:ABC transporter permease subunit [Oceanotoga teriensis]PWJ91208.1 maltose/maltodextrin transport system permease protein [Oceanotoga teriensis]
MAKIERKNYLIRHIVLILLTFIILFPLIWVISTSIRRDNAAFSPKLFSDRVTANNYKELLFPKKNVPEIVKSLNQVSGYIGDYSEYSVEEAQKESEELLNELRIYFNDTRNEMEENLNIYQDIFKLYDEKYKSKIISDSNELKNKDFNIFKKELESLNKELNLNYDKYEKNLSIFLNERQNITLELLKIKNESNIDYINETIDTIYKIPLKTTLWKIRTYKKWVKEDETIDTFADKIFNLEDMWKSLEIDEENLNKSIEQSLENNYSDLVIQKEKIENNINNIETKIQDLESKISIMDNNAKEYLTKLIAISDQYIPESKKIMASYNLIKDLDFTKIEGKEPLFGEDIKFYESVKAFSNNMNKTYNNVKSIDRFKLNGFNETLKNFEEVYNFLNENFTKIYALKDDKSVLSSYQALKSITIKLSVSIDEIVEISEKYNEYYTNLLNYQDEIQILNKDRDNFVENLKVLNEENQDKLEIINKSKNLSKLIFYKNYAEQQIKNIEETKLYSDFIGTNYYSFYKPEYNRYAILEWDTKFKESYNKYIMGKDALNKIIENMEDEISVYDANLESFLNLNYGGNISSIKYLENINMMYERDYSAVKADISRASRIVNDLADNTEYSELKTKMKKIDKNLYYLQQNWEKKIRKPFLKWLFNSFIVAGLSSIFTVLVTSLAAYPFSRMRFFGRKSGLYFLMIIQMFPTVMFMIAIYGILNFMGDYIPLIGLDSLGGLIFAYMGNVAYNMWLFKGYYDTIPDSLEESAMIDGATRFQTFWKIVLPLSLPIIAVITIMTFMNTFNEFVIAKIVLQSEANYTYAVGLQTFSQGPFETQWGLFTAAALIGALPMVIIFLTMQKWIVGGLTQGSVKG